MTALGAAFAIAASAMAQVGGPQARSLSISVQDAQGVNLNEATVGALTIEGVMVKATVLPDGRHYVHQVGDKTVLEIADAGFGFARVELALPEDPIIMIDVMYVGPGEVVARVDWGPGGDDEGGGAVGGGEDCGSATVIPGLPYSDTGSTLGAVDDYDEICPFNTPGAGDVVYSYTPGVNQTISISLCLNSAYDTKLYVYENVCGPYQGGTEIACNDDACSTPSFPSPFVSEIPAVALTAGNTYYIVVDGYLGDEGSYTIDIEGLAGPPENDFCENAIGPLAVPSVTDGTTAQATEDDDAPFCGTGITSPGVWYTVIGTGTTMTAKTCGPLFDYDTKISVYCGPCDDLVCIDGNDDNCPDGASGLLSTVQWCSQAGALYRILVHGFGGQSGDFQLFLSENGVPCTADVECLPQGACCFPDETCLVTTEAGCIDLGGEYQGDETDCGVHFFTIEDCDADFEDISGTGIELTLSDDDGEFVPIGFEFNFFKDPHSEIAVCSNGYLTFGTDLTDFTNDQIPDPNDPDDFIAPFWDDLDPGNVGSPATVHYQTLGDPGSQRFIAQWTDVPEFPNSGANTFQAVLYEGSNCIQFRYGPFTADTSGTDVTIGVENQDGSDGAQVPGPVAEGDCVELCPFQSDNPCEILEIEVNLDIKPGSCPNPLNRGSNGVIPVAAVGTMDFDVSQVDISTLEISRADGVGGSVGPNEGPPGPQTEIEDVATPFEGELCECHELEGDGIDDLSMKFRTQEVVEALELGDLNPGDFVELCVTGLLLDGTPFVGCDCVVIVPPGDGGLLLVDSNAPGVFVNVAPLDQTEDGGGFATFQRTYDMGRLVTITAPANHEGLVFEGWVLGESNPSLGRALHKDQTINVLIFGNQRSVKAVYKRPSMPDTPEG
ncbi:MAG: nidogen-like domain-containing protein [Planctomycetota bacterium]|jgi:hypothetical protein